MSSETSPASDLSSEPKSKKRRTPGACDVCKKRKIRCDSGQMPGNRCTNCLNSGLECTHAEIMKTLGSAKGYVESLETRLEKMERLLNKLLPGIDFTEQLENDDEPDLLAGETESLPRNDADHLLGAIKKLTLNPEHHRFFGKSSGIQFVQTALNFKSHFAGPHDSAVPLYPILPQRRNEYWEPVKWLLPPIDDEDNPQYTFPEPDLLQSLIQLYFANVNCFYPILHKPTFERNVAAKLHLRDHRFAATLLMVCSLGARNSDDPRVYLDSESSFHSAGWKWHNQVRVIPKHLIYKPNLYELQTIAMSSLFLLALSPVAWNQIGFGLRRAQDVGAHRRMKQSHPTAEHELWKRVFWVLLCLDWMAGTATGRPLAMHDQDYDQDYPVDCDDEFWQLPEPLNFRQPKNKPSELSYFICYAKLLEIQASVTSTIYSPRKPRDLAGRPFQPSDAQNIIAYDSALNSWLLEIPEHLRWDPDRQNRLHFNQSALLYAGYYNVQIMVHRPYIPAPLETSRPGALPSLAICTNAARSCARIFHAQDRLGLEPNQNFLSAAFTSAIVLLLNTWSGKRSGFAYNPGKEMEDVYKCLNLLQKAEKRYLAAGRFSDILVRLISVGDSGADAPFARNYTEDTVPPSAQRGYELSSFVGGARPTESSDPTVSKWPPELTQQYIADFQSRNDRVDDTLRSRPLAELELPQNGPLYAYNHSKDTPVYNGVTDLEQLMRMDPQQFPDMLVDSDVMSMWSAAPSGFQCVICHLLFSSFC
ncbi:fungal-specific transcription factor domain-containing protein [Mycena rosella]|uniref:Fungal-specific transcription factor domain-containing protein n=1 Tax=Mycena rosella TaxID=1033263 RepID=A0AAD7H1Q0_MYCRO|nr:fungal-specific transcription factor domain-containing protein [Mycena rosella]